MRLKFLTRLQIAIKALTGRYDVVKVHAVGVRRVKVTEVTLRDSKIDWNDNGAAH